MKKHGTHQPEPLDFVWEAVEGGAGVQIAANDIVVMHIYDGTIAVNQGALEVLGLSLERVPTPPPQKKIWFDALTASGSLDW